MHAPDDDIKTTAAARQSRAGYPVQHHRKRTDLLH